MGFSSQLTKKHAQHSVAKQNYNLIILSSEIVSMLKVCARGTVRKLTGRSSVAGKIDFLEFRTLEAFYSFSNCAITQS